MKNIILDTSIFIRENFFHGKKINSLLTLSRRGKINIYITEITYNELIANFEKKLAISVANHNRFRKDKENWILQNDIDLQNFFPKVNSKKILSEFISELDKLISDSVIKIIPYKTIDIKIVFDKYFKPEPPFGLGDKKSEFPDAFSMELIDDFCKTEGIKGIVFSTDNDLLTSSFPNFEVRSNYEDYLEAIFTKIEKVKKDITDSLFLSNTTKFKNEFVEWFDDNLDDNTLYYDAVNWKDVHEVDIEEILVRNLTYKIIEIVGDVVTIEVQAKVKVKVNILTDDEDFMYYDSDDKSHHYYETKYEELEKEFDSSLIAYTEIIDEDDYLEDFEVESINDNKEIYFDLDNGYR